MADLIAILNLVEYTKSNDPVNFKLNIKFLPDYVIDFTNLLNDEQKEKAIQWCREYGFYLVHKIVASAEKVEHIMFIKNNLELYSRNHLRDNDEKTWLHTAVENNRNTAILAFLVDELKIDLGKVDINKHTALHLACQKQTYVEGELQILIKESDQLIVHSYDDVTPIELACTNKNKLKEIKRHKNIDLDELLGRIDKISSGLLVTEDYNFNEKLTTERVWLSLLQKNNKYRLINYIKKDPKFSEKYYLTQNDINYIISNCQENGNGILTFIKNTYFKNNTSMTSKKLFSELTGLKIKETQEKASNENVKEKENKNEFHNSSLFLALITGRFELVSTLLACCQFDVISYGLFVCLICQNLSVVSEFPDQVVENIKKLKTFCEKYSMAVMSRAVYRDFTPKKTTVSEFLNKPNILAGQRILDIAYLGKCSKFLSLPSCQAALTRLWNKKTRRCPVVKFYLHSLIHCVFLMLFSHCLVHDFYSKITVLEILCYIYGFGYFIEEVRQILVYRETDFIKSYIKDPTNYIDIGSLGFMFIGFILRLSLRSPDLTSQGEYGLYIESQHINLFPTRLILCLSLILFFMRIIYFGSIFEQLGPKLKMISIMIVRNLIPLIFIFIVFIASFGVTFQALLHPNGFYSLNYSQNYERVSTPFLLGEIFKRSTYNIFHTHYALEEMEHRETPYFVNHEGNVASFFLLVIYMIVANIVLMNLLIALFSYTVTAIVQKSSESWKLNRYKDVKEYHDRSILPPPLNIFEIIVELIVIRSRKKVILEVNEEEAKLVKNDVKEKNGVSTSFRVLQALALRDRRHKLVLTREDEDYERKIELKTMRNAIIKIENVIKNKFNTELVPAFKTV